MAKPYKECPFCKNRLKKITPVLNESDFFYECKKCKKFIYFSTRKWEDCEFWWLNINSSTKKLDCQKKKRRVKHYGTNS